MDLLNERLGARLYNILRVHGIRSLEDFSIIDPAIMKAIPNFGRSSYEELLVKLSLNGIIPGNWDGRDVIKNMTEARLKTRNGWPLYNNSELALLYFSKHRDELYRYFKRESKNVIDNSSVVDESTPLCMLTLGQLLAAIAERQHPSQPEGNKNYVYGLRGIQDLFNVSHKTAQQYKNTWLAPACMQSGRKIVVDADKAMELFRARHIL